ncbi:FHA domain-containing protein [Roseibium sp.]|uniref:FHA domain-containing protein n=1 Tax=Roseibium sp. TaxID=1936156 RepID=UPI003BB2230B
MFQSQKPSVSCVTPSGKTIAARIKGEFFVIGSSSEADLRINAPDVADRHALIRRVDGRWVVQVEGLNPVSIDGELLTGRDRILSSGDKLGIANLEIEFTDPVEVAAREKARKKVTDEARNQEKPTTERPIYLLPMAFGSATVSLLLLLALALKDPDTKTVDFGKISTGSIEAAVSELPACLAAAAERRAGTPGQRELDLRSPYSLLSRELQATGQDGSPKDISAFQATVRRKLDEGMRAETELNDKPMARDAYQQVRELVPDLRCPANLLASSRLAELGG